MLIEHKKDFINTIRDFNISSENIIVKPNWLSNGEGEFTEPEILKWLFEALPGKKLIVVESYTPWRGLIYEPKFEGDELKVDLTGGKEYWDFYQELDKKFLHETGIGRIFEEYDVEYINITEEVWSNRVVNPEKIKQEIEKTGYKFFFNDFYGYFPSKLYGIRNKSTFISLAKLKIQAHESVLFSFSIKNLYGLIPSPSRMQYHDVDNNYVGLSESLIDIYLLYYILFQDTLWINEGIFTQIQEHFGEDQYVERGENLLFAGTDPLSVDAEACSEFGLDPNRSDYYRRLARQLKQLRI